MQEILSKEDLAYMTGYTITHTGVEGEVNFSVEENWTRQYFDIKNPEIILFGLVEETKIVTKFELFTETKIIKVDIDKILEKELENAKINKMSVS